MLRGLAILSLLVLTGCRGCVDYEDLDDNLRERWSRPCSEDDACTAVVMPCDPCGCANRAILSARVAELADMARRVDCETAPAPEQCSPCAAQRARCRDGVCALVRGKPENPQLDLDLRVQGAPVHVSAALAEWTENSLSLHFDLGPRACHLADDAPLSLMIERAPDGWRLSRCHVNGEPWDLAVPVPEPRPRIDASGMLVIDLDVDVERLRVQGRVVAHDCAPSAHTHTPRQVPASVAVRERELPVGGALLFTGADEHVLLVSAESVSCASPERSSPVVAGFRWSPRSPVVEQVCVGGTDLPVQCQESPQGVAIHTRDGPGGLVAAVETRAARVGYRLAVEGALYPAVCGAVIDLEQVVRHSSGAQKE